MKRLIMILLSLAFIIPALISEVTYLTDDEYKKLNKEERQNYWENLETEMEQLSQRKADAIASHENNLKRIEELKLELAQLEKEYVEVRQRILSFLGLTEADGAAILAKIEYFNSKLANWKNLSDDQLWEYKKAIKELIDEYYQYRNSKYGKHPDFIVQFNDLDRSIKRLEDDLKNARPKYYEDEYQVRQGDYLSKIAGYDFIYNDPKKWGIIYRANRDVVKDPNVLQINQILKIPRGLPNSWKVYKGECLWKIASYPEVYGNGAKWNLIYRANKDQIKDPDLIYPNQIFTIPRD